ncbi:MAG: penicillin-binding protein 2 [Lachnospiraceae bacterium]|nr:penicillin-binding protein 2 [Lachnospiraceae bacterium]
MRTEIKKRKKKKARRSRQALYASVIFTLIFAGMIANLVLFELNESGVAYTNTYNERRMESIRQETRRGNIFAAKGELLAYSTEDASGNEIRRYPYGRLFAHSVGYASQGASGIEKSCGQYLMRSDISLDEKLSNDLHGKKDAGDDVYLTLDPAVQEVAYNALGDYRGAVVVSEVKTGRILALVSKPDFDPGDIDKKWDKIRGDEEKSPLLNRASQGLYPPGSTFKIITALEYIRENSDTYEDYHFNCSGKFTYEDSTISCFHGNVHGAEDLTESFADSCNSSFANIGTGLDRLKFADTLESLYFNKELPVDIVSNQSHVSMRKNMSAKSIIQTAIGQSETMISPLHLNMITSSIANGGVMMRPYMTEKICSGDGRVLKSFKPETLSRVMTEDEASALCSLMEAVVEKGTGKALAGQPYTAAGKTGSAEFSDSSDLSHAWFTGFAPAEDPEIAVTVIMEKAGTGGSCAAPLAKRIFADYFARKMLK